MNNNINKSNNTYCKLNKYTFYISFIVFQRIEINFTNVYNQKHGLF